MYYSYPQRSVASAATTSRFHTSATTYRKFAARFIVMLVLMLTIVSVGAIVKANAGGAVLSGSTTGTITSASTPSAADAAATVIVERGDSLWTIASEHAPKGTDVRLYINQLKKANHLKNASLQEGQVLVLP